MRGEASLAYGKRGEEVGLLSFPCVFYGVSPVMWTYLKQSFRLPLAWFARNGNGDFYFRAPEREPFLANSAWCQDQLWRHEPKKVKRDTSAPHDMLRLADD